MLTLHVFHLHSMRKLVTHDLHSKPNYGIPPTSLLIAYDKMTISSIMWFQQTLTFPNTVTVYSIYSFCEYLVVLTNVAFHTVQAVDFQASFNMHCVIMPVMIFTYYPMQNDYHLTMEVARAHEH